MTALRRIREERKLSQWDAARLVRRSQSWWWSIENGYKSPPPALKERIAQIFGEKPEDLFANK